MKKIKYVLLFIFIYLLFPLNCGAVFEYERTSQNPLVPSDVKVDSGNIEDILRTPAINPKDKIYDFAGILTDKEENELYEQIIGFIKNTKIDSLIVTTNDLLGYSISSYAYNFYDYNDFNQEGLIFVVYINNNKPEIFMGNSGKKDSKVFKVYNDDNIHSILKITFNDYISKGLYFDGCKKYISIVENLYLKSFGNYVVDEKGEVVSNISWSYIISASAVITVIIILIFIIKFVVRNKKVTNSIKNYVDSKNVVIKMEYDIELKK